jgi:hypothetical protein
MIGYFLARRERGRGKGVYGVRMRTVGKVELDGGDGLNGRKGNPVVKHGKTEDEAQRAREPHWENRI